MACSISFTNEKLGDPVKVRSKKASELDRLIPDDKTSKTIHNASGRWYRFNENHQICSPPFQIINRPVSESSITSFSHLFQSCSSLQEIDSWMFDLEYMKERKRLEELKEKRLASAKELESWLHK